MASNGTSNLQKVVNEDKNYSSEMCHIAKTSVLPSKECLEEQESAIYVKNVCKSYKSSRILQNLCMILKKGEIYGLLGPSGSGKSTVLSCIVGLEKWESGEVLVFGKNPGYRRSSIDEIKLGYMPQDIAMHKELTILELVQFFGKIYCMTNTEILNMWNFLCRLLELPINSTLIRNLSGGEKRRASLALAMLNSPDILILDEPTVGVDPLIRKNIWEHLYKLVKSSGITVLITTHYIEEARLSDTIGVIRNGYMLVEDTPTNILSTYNCNFLEDAMIKICKKDELKSRGLKANPPSNSYIQPNQYPGPKYSTSWNKKHASYSLTTRHETRQQLDVASIKNDLGFIDNSVFVKENRSPGFQRSVNYYGFKGDPTGLRTNYFVKSIQITSAYTKVKLLTFLRDPIFFGTILLLPTIHAVLSLISVGSKPTGLHLGIVNNELSNWPMECLLPKHLGNSCDLSFLTCKYLNHLGNGDLLILDSFDSRMEALAQVNLGNSWGYVEIPKNFSQSNVELATSRFFSHNESISGSRIHVHLDHSGKSFNVVLDKRYIMLSSCHGNKFGINLFVTLKCMSPYASLISKLIWILSVKNSI